MNLPNKLTILRIILVPFFVLFMLLSGDIFPHHNLVALAILALRSVFKKTSSGGCAGCSGCNGCGPSCHGQDQETASK